METHGIIEDYYTHEYDCFEVVENAKGSFKDFISGKSFGNEKECAAAVNDIIKWKSNQINARKKDFHSLFYGLTRNCTKFGLRRYQAHILHFILQGKIRLS